MWWKRFWRSKNCVEPAMSAFDSPWKEVLDCYFRAFLSFFFPHIHDAIDWSQPVESLDKELLQVMPDAETGARFVDKLVKVWRLDGTAEWVLIHVEVQYQTVTTFPKRMFVYYYRLLDRYAQKVVSLAILGDQRADWRPDVYHEELWGCQLDFRYPVVKLADYETNWQALELHTNPFAIVVLAHLKARETQKDMAARKDWKFRIVRGLYQRGMPASDIRQLFRFIDWIMDLPEPLALAFDNDVFQLEQEKAMPYVTSIERHGIEKGIEQGIEQGKREGLLKAIEIGMRLKFGASGMTYLPEIQQIDTVHILESVADAIEGAASIDELRQKWKP
jgi:hypothetical protein